MGTKENPGKYDCYANARPDEPMFVLLGRDPSAALLVFLWAKTRARLEGKGPQAEEALVTAQAMAKYADQAKGPGETRRHAEAMGQVVTEWRKLLNGEG